MNFYKSNWIPLICLRVKPIDNYNVEVMYLTYSRLFGNMEIEKRNFSKRDFKKVFINKKERYHYNKVRFEKLPIEIKNYLMDKKFMGSEAVIT